MIPVVLETCGEEPALPVFLKGMTWVDFRQRQPDPLAQLIWGITGERPDAAAAEEPPPEVPSRSTSTFGSAWCRRWRSFWAGIRGGGDRQGGSKLRPGVGESELVGGDIETQGHVITAANPEEEALAAWFGEVAADNRRLADHFERPVELQDLEKAWVRLEVTRPTAAAAGLGGTDDETRLGTFEPRTLDDFLALDPEEHPWITRRWLVEGDPGSGKTTLLRRVAGQRAAACDRAQIPVFISLPRLIEPVRPLTEYLGEELGTLCGEALPEVLDGAGRNGRLLLLFDGLDEVAPERRGRVEKVLRRIDRDWLESSVVLTSRPIGLGRLPAGFHKLLLQPFGDDERRSFLAKWFGHRGEPAEAHRAIDHFDSELSLRELSHNPLHLTLLTVLWEKGVKPPRRRSQLYQAIFDLLLEGRHREPPRPIAATADVREVLRHLAFGLTRDDLPAAERADLERRLWDDEFDEVRRRLVKVWGRELRGFLDEIYERSYILGPHDGPRAAWRFWHRTFGEALTAEKLHQMLEAEGAGLLDELRTREGGTNATTELVLAFHHGDEGRWAEPFALLTGYLDDPDEMVVSLVAANRALGLRAMATAQGLRDKTFDEVLALTDKWQDRRQVYEQLPRILNDPERTLALVDQIRRRTRDGNDLFFLERTVAAVREEWPAARPAADRLEARFYDHIPAPPVELFRSIDTARDGRMTLWCEIPAGSFRWEVRPARVIPMKSPAIG